MASNKELASHYRALAAIGEKQGLETMMDVIYGTLADLDEISPDVERWKIKRQKEIEKIRAEAEGTE